MYLLAIATTSIMIVQQQQLLRRPVAQAREAARAEREGGPRTNCLEPYLVGPRVDCQSIATIAIVCVASYYYYTRSLASLAVAFRACCDRGLLALTIPPPHRGFWELIT